MYSRDIAILANSRKYGGHCIAGKDIRTKEWVRLICKLDSSRNTVPFNETDLRKFCGRGEGPSLFSCYRIHFVEKCGIYCQPENELISREPWQLIGNFLLEQLHEFIDTRCPRWLGDPGYGKMDNIPLSVCNPQSPLSSSLFFSELMGGEYQLEIGHKMTMHDRIQYVLKFFINGTHYSLVITDISVENALIKKALIEGQLSSAYVTIGVGQIYKEMSSHYKLVVGLAPLK
jgi:hypothetical protein